MGIAGSSFFWPNSDPERHKGGVTLEEARKAAIEELEESGFNWLVFIVAASGFFTDSYNLFASNVILPALSYVYWENNEHGTAIAFNLTTLIASAIGQVLFGYLADRFGRKALYGIELIIVIISTTGLLQSSYGFSDGSGKPTWSINGWILFWRAVMGLGIGAEYPLSGCIAAEWSSTQSRGRMIAAVFAMQPLGQLCAYAAGLTALQAFGHQSAVEVDKQWRYVVGIGGIPTLLALGFRLSMPEGGRYLYDLRGIPDAAPPPTQNGNAAHRTEPESPNAETQSLDGTARPAKKPFFTDMWEFLFKEGHWRDLFGTSVCWLLLDFAFYGLGFNNPSTLAKLWSSERLNFPDDAPHWLKSSSIKTEAAMVDGRFAPEDAEYLIGEVLLKNMTHAIYTVSIASILGSVAVIACINRFERKTALTLSFALLAVVLAAASGSFHLLFQQGDRHIVLIVFWIAISFMFSFGPNTLTFIIPAECFPTRFRCTLYGIAAAWGKVGAVIVQLVILAVPSISEPDRDTIQYLLAAFAVCMAFGALFSHNFVPQVQERTGPHEKKINCMGKEVPASPYKDIPLERLPLKRLSQEVQPRTVGSHTRDHEMVNLPNGADV